MTLPLHLTEATAPADNCQHCGHGILFVKAPASPMFYGYTGYWYHPHNQHVLCDGPEAMEHASHRAAP